MATTTTQLRPFLAKMIGQRQAANGAFFTFSSMERAVIERRHGPAMKLGLALHLGGSCA